MVRGAGTVRAFVRALSGRWAAAGEREGVEGRTGGVRPGPAVGSAAPRGAAVGAAQTGLLQGRRGGAGRRFGKGWRTRRPRPGCAPPGRVSRRRFVAGARVRELRRSVQPCGESGMAALGLFYLEACLCRHAQNKLLSFF